MRVRGFAAAMAVSGLVLAGCGGEARSAADDEPTRTTSATSSRSTSSATATPTKPAGIELAVEICTERIAGPDTLVSDAASAARAGTRSVSEVAAAFRQAQDGVEALASEAGAGQLDNLARALTDYSAVLGRARVVGDVGLTEITDAREAINIACYSP